jgi:16S rRNA (guanine527-N7)-methyltransferase
MRTPTAELSDASIQTALAPYGLVPETQICDSIRVYINLLLRWNQRLSLTTVTSPSEILRFHIGESIAAIPIAKATEGRLADVGSGAGFPGIPLALLAPHLEVSLIESSVKKATFLAEALRELRLGNARTLRARYEEIDIPRHGFDFICARALGQYETLLSWSTRALSTKGRVILWLGSEDAAKIAKSKEWCWQEPSKLLGTKARVLLIGNRPE